MGRVGQSALYEQDGEVYLVVDEASYEVNWMGLAASWVCETAEELESEIGLPPGSLQATVNLYNRHAEQGEDPLFYKGHDWVRPLVPPLGAFDLRSAPLPTRRSPWADWRRRWRARYWISSGQPIAGSLRRRPHHGRRVLIRLRQRPLHRRQHALRSLRRLRAPPPRGQRRRERVGATAITLGAPAAPDWTRIAVGALGLGVRASVEQKFAGQSRHEMHRFGGEVGTKDPSCLLATGVNMSFK